MGRGHNDFCSCRPDFCTFRKNAIKLRGASSIKRLTESSNCLFSSGTMLEKGNDCFFFMKLGHRRNVSRRRNAKKKPQTGLVASGDAFINVLSIELDRVCESNFCYEFSPQRVAGIDRQVRGSNFERCSLVLKLVSQVVVSVDLKLSTQFIFSCEVSKQNQITSFGLTRPGIDN